MSAKPKFYTKEISPDEAQKLLRTNTKNRALSQSTIKHYAKQMTDGEWEFNGETICISERGKLLNGQHRLSAVILSGVPVTFAFCEGVKDKAIKTIDTGKMRSNADHLRIHGFNIKESHFQVVAAAIRIIHSFDESGTFGDRKEKLTPTKCIRFVEKHPKLLKSMEFIGSDSKKSPVPASILVAMHYLFAKHDEQKASIFFDRLLTGANLTSTSPILALRTRLQMVNDSKRMASSRKMMISYLIQAYRAYVNGNKISIQGFQYRPSHDIVLDFRKRKH